MDRVRLSGKPVPCPVCGSGQRKLFGPLVSTAVANTNDFSLAQCQLCTMFYCYPMPDISTQLDRLYGKGYFAHQPHRSGIWKVDYQQVSHEAVVRLWFGKLREEKLAPGERLLDIGCGQGIFLAVARNCGWDAEGFDVTDVNRAEIERNTGIRIKVGGHPLDCFERASFDALYCNSVLEHVGDPVGFMAELKALLVPGGTLFLTFPNENALMVVYARMLARLLGRPPLTQQPLEHPFHILGFTSKALDHLVRLGRWETRWIRKCWGPDVFTRHTYQKPASYRGRAYDRAMFWVAVFGDWTNHGRYFQMVLRKPRREIAGD